MAPFAAVVLLAAVRPAAPAPPATAAAALAAAAGAAFEAEPAASVEDAYKWLFQAARGGEHAAPSEPAARAWLEKEWADLGPAFAGEPIVVPLRPDGAVVRLNLRPFRDAGGDREALLAAFLASARGFHGDADLFVAAWRAFGRTLPCEGAEGRDARAFERLDRESEAAGWPARHHGASYAAALRPAYRVLTGEAATALLAGREEAR